MTTKVPPYDSLPIRAFGILRICEEAHFSKEETTAMVLRLCTKGGVMLSEIETLTGIPKEHTRKLERMVLMHPSLRTAWKGNHPIDLFEREPERKINQHYMSQFRKYWPNQAARLEAAPVA